MMRKNGIKKIGQIGVDAGLCWIGDPCYVLHTDEVPKAIGKNWQEFCNNICSNDEYPKAIQFNHDNGHEGLGVCVSTGHGDGTYPVFAEFDDGILVKVWVEFNGQSGAHRPMTNKEAVLIRFPDANPVPLFDFISIVHGENQAIIGIGTDEELAWEDTYVALVQEENFARYGF
jgi:hypothetical protein